MANLIAYTVAMDTKVMPHHISIDRYKGSGALDRPMITAFGVFFLIALPVMALWGYTQPGLTQTRMLTMDMWWGITFVSIATVYAMRFAKKDADVQ